MESRNNGKGLITNLQDYSVHDGYGLRVLVFFKGCPLRCEWCQNPENIHYTQEIQYRSVLCNGAGKCVRVCPVEGAIIPDSALRVDRGKCTACMRCCEACPTGALSQVGQWMTPEEVYKKVIRYRPFFDASGGGVTLSGGEPTFQPEFTAELLKMCHEVGVHTAVETCGFASYDTISKVAQHCDLILFDIKHMDEESHQRGTGQKNGLILDNLHGLCRDMKKDIVVRIPLIAGFNDDDDNIRQTAEYVISLKTVKHIDMLPFNEFASGKYHTMGLDWAYSETKRQPPERLARLQDIVQSYGLEATVGGGW